MSASTEKQNNLLLAKDLVQKLENYDFGTKCHCEKRITYWSLTKGAHSRLAIKKHNPSSDSAWDAICLHESKKSFVTVKELLEMLQPIVHTNPSAVVISRSNIKFQLLEKVEPTLTLFGNSKCKVVEEKESLANSDSEERSE